MKKTLAKYVAAAVFGLGLTTSAHAIDTLVQVNTDGVAGYDVKGINEFDWQSSGDLVILDDLLGNGNTANGALYDSFTQWALNAVVGDTVDFALHAHARLNDMIDANGGSVKPANMSTNGTGGPGTFEITAALSGIEHGEVVAPGILSFSGISGNYEWFFDTTPDSNVANGTGFIDGASLMKGTLGPAGTNGGFNRNTGNGFTNLKNTVTSYDSTLIQTDPSSLAPLIGTTFNTLIKLELSGLAAKVCLNGTCPIGLDPYIAQEGDLQYKADANSQFTAQGETPEPGTLFILGLGLLGLRLSRRARA